MYCNQNPVDEKDLFYFVIVKEQIKGFIVCKGKLEEIWKFEGDYTTTCVDFTSSKKGSKSGGD